MQAMSALRKWQFDMMANNLVIIEQVITTISDPAVFQRRDGEDGWTISEVLGHIADYEMVFLERAKLTVETDNPPLPAPDQNELVIEHRFASQNALDVLKQWQTNRVIFLDYLKSLPEDETIWERPALHPRRGEMSLNDQLSLVTWHDNNHLHQIVKIING